MLNKFIRFPFVRLFITTVFSFALVGVSACNNKVENDNVSIAPEKSITELKHYSKRAIQDDIFYFVLPDRFNNGNKENDHGSNEIEISRGGFDPSKSTTYHGGDLIGLTEKLPYIKAMGITAIWLTPILRNQAVQNDVSGYHGYWILDFTEIDPHLGSNADLKNLIELAHQQNIKIFFDIIVNHTADVVKYTECHGEDGLGWTTSNEGCPYISLAEKAAGKSYTPILPNGMEQIKTPAWLNDPKYYHNQGETTYQGENSLNGDFAGLDDLNTEMPEVVTGMANIYKNIIAEFRPDGFRIDTVKHVNMAFWQQFSPDLVSYAQEIGIENFFMFGEVYTGNIDELSQFTTVGKLQSVLDFPLQFTLQDTLVKQQGTDKLAAHFSRDIQYEDEDSDANTLITFTGNHDMGRFAHFLEKSDFNYSDDEKIKRTLLAHAFLYFARGIPVIYYGDEQGFVGTGGDRESRQDMMPSQVESYNSTKLLATNDTTTVANFDQQHVLYQAFARYAILYQQHSALRYGIHKNRYSQATAGIYAFERKLANEKPMLVVFNTAATKQTVSFNATASTIEVVNVSDNNGHKMSLVDKQQITVSLAPLSFAIYQEN